MNIKKVYEYALQREYDGREFFLRNAERTGHAAAAGVFRRLADEEEKHIRFIQGLLNALEAGQEASAATLEGEGFFSQRAATEMLDQTLIESMIPDVTVLRTAYLIERDFAEFYQMAADKATGEAKAALTKLAQWERGHERLFKELHDKVFQQYMEMPWGG